MLTDLFKNKEGMKLPIKPIALVLGKIIGMLICTFLCVGFFTVIPMLLFQSKPEQGHPSLVQSLVLSPLMLLAGCLVVYTFRTSVDGKSFRSLGFRLNHIVSDTLIGLFFGGGLIAIGLAVVPFLGDISVSVHSFDISHIWLWLIVFVLAASFEEIVFRGYILNNLIDVMPRTGALLFSAIIFSIFHGGTLSFGWVPFINLTLAGMLLGQAWFYTRSLWMPIVLHTSWNFFQGPVCGFKVSGETVNDTIFSLSWQSDSLINGGQFGFEGSLVCLVLQLAAIAALYFWNKKLRLNRINNKKPAGDLPVMYT